MIYARQSQDRDGTGDAVDRQVVACRRVVEDRGWTLVGAPLVDNDASGSTGKRREQYERLLTMLREGTVDVAVVWNLDRLTRRLADVVEVLAICKDSGAKVTTVTGDLDLSTDTGRMLAGILTSVAMGEVERKGRRQRAANAQRAERGHMGWTRRPFAYDRDHGRIVVVPHEAEALRRAAVTVSGGGTVAAAVREFDRQGLTTTAGKPWSVTSLRRALMNPRYAGRVTYDGADVGAGTWPVILEQQAQERLAEVLSDVRRRTQQGTEPKYLLSGLARCGRCSDALLFASPMTSKGRRWQVYRCRSCYLTRRSDLVDEVVEVDVLARLSMPDAAALLAPDVDLDGLRAEADRLRRRRDDLAALLADGLLSAEAVRVQAKALSQRIAVVQRELAAAVGTSPVAALVSAVDVVEAWGLLDVRTRKSVVDLLLSVTILPAGRGSRFDRSQVRLAWKGGQS